jgi:hypothetical protein
VQRRAYELQGVLKSERRISPATLAAMLPMPFIVWGSLIYQNRLESRYADVRDKVADILHLLNKSKLAMPHLRLG